ncbi:PREDICTED: serine carboxypeptidase-like 40 [Ipomoea nil]|uniref:serine carboxypeptidase-like 40 n=1 Tax=Ipomoea nil TaxID=35883 RepID=UPI000900C47A|nr:PREDICTED: serine carboxypeptidase-like 40 [Ipomoea nil]
MKITTLSPLVFLILFSLSCPLALSLRHGSRQIQALTQHYKAKRSSNSGIDTTTHFTSAIYSELDALILPQEGLKEKDRIERLPGQPPVRFDHYGGYVTVDQAAGRAFFYYFVEGYSKKESLPLLLWLNGGPGCSSLAYGAMQELGPFRVLSDGKTLFQNKFAWNHGANVLFLESPAGVGFSYSNTTSDFVKGGDKKTAKDNYIFLLNWLERFPEYKDRDFYIAGESYAGHYVPQLAHTILTHNLHANKTIINLKGILIGNAVVHDEEDEKGMYQYFASHALISDQTLGQVLKYCNFSEGSDYTKQPNECLAAREIASHNTGQIDIYNIYAPWCKNTNLTHKPKKPSLVIDPCSDYYVYAYLNRPDVQKALHANVTKMHYDWEPCSDVLRDWVDSAFTVIPLIDDLMSNGIRVWIFSGDIDGRVPVTSTKNSLKKMKVSPKSEWHPWFLDGEVGGYAQKFSGNLTFATVRGAGHQVPSYQPARALSLLLHFVAGTDLLDSTTHS